MPSSITACTSTHHLICLHTLVLYVLTQICKKRAHRPSRPPASTSAHSFPVTLHQPRDHPPPPLRTDLDDLCLIFNFPSRVVAQHSRDSAGHDWPDPAGPQRSRALATAPPSSSSAASQPARAGPEQQQQQQERHVHRRPPQAGGRLDEGDGGGRLPAPPLPQPDQAAAAPAGPGGRSPAHRSNFA